MLFSARSRIGSMSKRFISETLILVACLCLWGSQAAAAENPQAVVQTGTDKVLKILTQYTQDTRARREEIRAVVDGYFDFEAIAGLAVGPRWGSQSPEKQKEFTLEFSKLLFNTYIGDIQEYAKQESTYNYRSVDQGHVVVEAPVRRHGSMVSLAYYLHLKDGNWKVYDIAVDGIDLVANYRSQFNSILANSSFDNLSMILRRKIARMCAVDPC
jgi:phospholipid transport system substrate-binding protein